MNKRVVFGVGATVATALLSVSGVAFADGLDYAMSVGQVDMADTANYAIEATSDGGYVAGGQTVQCFKLPGGGERLSGLYGGYSGWIENWIPDNAEPAMMEECEEYFADQEAGDLESFNGKVDAPVNVMTAARKDAILSAVRNHTLLDDYCDGFELSSGGTPVMGTSFSSASPFVTLADYDHDATYRYYCVDYIAKFKQDGTKEWLTTIRNGDLPVAVGETTSDYRLITKWGMLYTFAKTNGANGDEIITDAEKVQDAIINNDGTVVVVEWGDIGLLNSDGEVDKVLEYVETETTETEISANGSPSNRALVRTSDGFIAMREKWEKTTDDDGNEDWVGTTEIVKISTDLETIEPIISFSEDDMEEIRGLYIVSADQDGNVGLVAIMEDEENDRYVPVIITIDSEGNAIAAKELSDLMDPEGDEMALILDNFTIVDPNTGKLTRLNADLTEIDNYPLADGEMVYDAVVLTDSSMAAVGRSTVSTDNYTVDGNVNGTYLRLTATKAPNGTTNPQTGDEVNIFAISSAFATLVAAGLVTTIIKRRK